MDRTIIKPNIEKGFITKIQEIFSIGSCFSESVGKLMADDGFQITINPVGILFNPDSIEKIFRNALKDEIDSEHFGSYMDVHFHYDHHSRMNGKSREEVELNIREGLKTIKNSLLRADRLFLTFGTSWVYMLNSTEKVVANCHKVPQKEFSKKLLDINDLKIKWKELLRDILSKNERLEVILTVSPIRHTRKGIHENNVSKAVLLLLCDTLEKEFGKVRYFPSYEIVLDELRDYHYYRKDLIHPTEEALQIIYQRFRDCYC